MASIPALIKCSNCKKRVLFLYSDNLCRDCLVNMRGETATMNELEKELAKKEHEIADLKQIIYLLQEMNTRIKQHNSEMAFKTALETVQVD